MTYDDLITPPPKSIDDREDAKRRTEVYDRIEAIVEDHATVQEGDRREPFDAFAVTVRVRIPFRVQAYRHDIDAADVDDVDPDKDVPFDDTDGWVETSSPTYVTVDFAHHSEHARDLLERIEPDEADARELLTDAAFDGMVNGVYESLREREASKPLTVEVIVREPIDEPVPRRQSDVDPTDGQAYETKYVTRRVGTARYRVDGIVPPEDFDT